MILWSFELFGLVLVALVAVSGEVTSVYVPGKTFILQFGHPRTGTTLQYNIVAQMAAHRNAAAGLPSPSLEYVPSGKEHEIMANAVKKTHHLEEFESALNSSSIPYMLFVTTSATSPFHDERAAYIQSKETIELNVMDVIDDYAKIFNLTKDQREKVAVHIKYWDIMRLCCGTQQSVVNRLRLHGCPPSIPWYDIRNPHCEIYDLSALEKLVNLTDATAKTPGNIMLSDEMMHDADIPEGSMCMRDQMNIIGGEEFNGQPFRGCPKLMDFWEHAEYERYVCQYEQFSDECKST